MGRRKQPHPVSANIAGAEEQDTDLATEDPPDDPDADEEGESFGSVDEDALEEPGNDGQTQYISKEEELRLIALAQGDDPEKKKAAIAALLEAHERFCWQRVRAHRKYFSPNLTPEDLFQETQLGLMHAIEKFEPERGNRLLTYAGWWVMQTLSRYITHKGTTQSVPVNFAPSDKKILKPYHEYMKTRRKEKGDEPLSAEERQEIHALTGKWPHEIDVILARAYSSAHSLNAPIGDKDGATFLDILTEGPFEPPDALAKRLSDRRFVERLMEKAGLNPKQKMVILARFGIGEEDGETRTLEEISKRLSVTKERIRQLESKALEKLAAAAKTEEMGPLEMSTSVNEDTGDSEMKDIRIRTLVQARHYQHSLHPAPIIQGNDDFFATISPADFIYFHCIYQLPLYIEQNGRPVALVEGRWKTPRGFFVLPKTAEELGIEAGKNPSGIGTLRAKYADFLTQAKQNGSVWFREGSGEKKTVLVLLPPTKEITKKLEDHYTKGSTPVVAAPANQPEQETGEPATAVETAEHETTALTVSAANPVENGPGTKSLAELFDPDKVLPDGGSIPAYSLPNPRNLVQTLRVLFAAVSDTLKTPETPVRIECPGNAVLVSANPDTVDYLLYRAESESNTFEFNADGMAPGDKKPVALVASFTGAAKGGVCITHVDGTRIALFPDDGRLEAAEFMQAVLGNAFPAPREVG